MTQAEQVIQNIINSSLEPFKGKEIYEGTRFIHAYADCVVVLTIVEDKQIAVDIIRGSQERNDDELLPLLTEDTVEEETTEGDKGPDLIIP